MPRKIDAEIETGEYFLKQSERDDLKRQEKRTKQAEKVIEREQEREKDFKPPKEDKRKTEQKAVDVDIQSAVENIKKSGQKRKKSDLQKEDDIEDYLITKKRKKSQE